MAVVVRMSPINLTQASSGRSKVITVERFSCRHMLTFSRYSPLRRGNCFLLLSPRTAQFGLR